VPACTIAAVVASLELEMLSDLGEFAMISAMPGIPTNLIATLKLIKLPTNSEVLDEGQVATLMVLFTRSTDTNKSVCWDLRLAQTKLKSENFSSLCTYLYLMMC
jgi:hypothetical protein